MNSRIKNQIKKSMENQVFEEKHHCIICSEKNNHKVNFKIDKVICKKCNNSAPIPDSTYESIYKELKKIGVQF